MSEISKKQEVKKNFKSSSLKATEKKLSTKIDTKKNGAASATRKTEFVFARAEGKSFLTIENQYGICRATAKKWDVELSKEIHKLREERLREIYATQGLLKDARLERVCKTLKKIEDVVDITDLETVSPDKLLDYQLKYLEFVKSEYVDLDLVKSLRESRGIVDIADALIESCAKGGVSTAQAREIINLALIKEKALSGRDCKVVGESLSQVEAMEAGDRLLAAAGILPESATSD